MAITREEKTNSKLQQLLAPVAINADKLDVEAVDVSGFESGIFTVMVGAANVNPNDDRHVQIRLQHSNDNVNFTDCLDTEIIGAVLGENTGTFAYLKTRPDDTTAFMAGYIGDKRFVRPAIKVTGDLGEGVLIGVAAILHGSKYRPVA
ncbi:MULTISPECIES: hypothetical protein [unclassified Candidatus Tisiphia]|uniref:hypothetical protein n=1 Tax=unclassified Candidatus Tisiphia TaxID=2996318 RepID=UPI0035C8ED17